MKVEMDVERRARHRDKTDVFAEDSQALDQIAKLTEAIMQKYAATKDGTNRLRAQLNCVGGRLEAAEQEQASATRLVNKMLLQNILPHHVGKAK